jgi:hypothetical protein
MKNAIVTGNNLGIWTEEIYELVPLAAVLNFVFACVTFHVPRAACHVPRVSSGE